MTSPSPAATERQKTKRRILEKFGREQCMIAIETYCHNCADWDAKQGHCQHDLAPLTLDGERCPYFTLTGSNDNIQSAAKTR